MRSEQTGDRISLEGMRFYGYHGCLPEEHHEACVVSSGS